jgi:WD40 repeat protein
LLWVGGGLTTMVGIKLQDSIVKSFGMGRVFKVRRCARSPPCMINVALVSTCASSGRSYMLLLQENTSSINSLDFHRQEDLLVTACEDDSVHLYNIESGTVDKTVFSRKYGVAHIRFTHHPYSVVYASNKVGCSRKRTPAALLA